VADKLAFRDYLRTHSNRAAAYGVLKQRLSRNYHHDIVGYMRGKDEFLKSLLAEARQWAEQNMHIEGIDHIQLAMPAGQEDAARSFYSGLLGIPEAPKPPDLATRGGVWFESNRVKVHLGIDPDFKPARKAHPGLLVHDLGVLVRKLSENGVTVVEAEPLPGYDHVYVADPFGNRIELMERRG
jgi:catechol 2,3-dioxygenase-like lactoylglutathione lyase family enzyme